MVGVTVSTLAPPEIARRAADALREELETFPKPGLVSPVDRGSHPDMDAQCFRDSITALEPSFALLAAAAAEGADFAALREIGRAAERAMVAATAGRNTHRGAIFCLGLLCAAAGAPHPSERTLGAVVRRRWGSAIPRLDEVTDSSHGVTMCRRHRLGGVRREAAEGFPSIYHHGLTALRGVRGGDRNAARVQTFFALLEVCEDTTLYKRGGEAGHALAVKQARDFLARGGVTSPGWEAAAGSVHRAFVDRGLTAGGVGDLLAATLFVAGVEPLIFPGAFDTPLP